jgi:hypothetical protein
MIEFKEWPKTPRLLRNITITEKIDGTNAAIGVVPVDRGTTTEDQDPSVFAYIHTPDGLMGVYAQSRTRLITPGKATDNYGFAGWVQQNAAELVDLLGEGLHYGEWWGNGIQRRYDRAEKWFSLFNTERYHGFEERTALNITSVPVLYQGPNDTGAVAAALESLRTHGSVAAPGFMNPEGICVYQAASRTISKVTLDANDAGKWEAA